MKKEVKRVLDEKRRAEENEIAEEAFTRIPHLPEELKMLILHHLSVSLIEKLELPFSTLRSVMQAKITKTGGFKAWQFYLKQKKNSTVPGKGAYGDPGAGQVHVDAQGRLQRWVARPNQAGQDFFIFDIDFTDLTDQAGQELLSSSIFNILLISWIQLIRLKEIFSFLNFWYFIDFIDSTDHSGLPRRLTWCPSVQLSSHLYSTTAVATSASGLLLR